MGVAEEDNLIVRAARALQAKDRMQAGLFHCCGQKFAYGRWPGRWQQQCGN